MMWAARRSLPQALKVQVAARLGKRYRSRTHQSVARPHQRSAAHGGRMAAGRPLLRAWNQVRTMSRSRVWSCSGRRWTQHDGAERRMIGQRTKDASRSRRRKAFGSVGPSSPRRISRLGSPGSARRVGRSRPSRPCSTPRECRLRTAGGSGGLVRSSPFCRANGSSDCRLRVGRRSSRVGRASTISGLRGSAAAKSGIGTGPRRDGCQLSSCAFLGAC